MDENVDHTQWPSIDTTIFPEIFPDCGGKTFLWAFQNKKEFCEFLLTTTKCTGIFKSFQDYLRKKIREN